MDEPSTLLEESIRRVRVQIAESRPKTARVSRKSVAAKQWRVKGRTQEACAHSAGVKETGGG